MLKKWGLILARGFVAISLKGNPGVLTVLEISNDLDFVDLFDCPISCLLLTMLILFYGIVSRAVSIGSLGQGIFKGCMYINSSINHEIRTLSL